ncbi:ParB/RepB/Spo0J family partition protein [Microbacterium sp. NPDC078428]|uniref:ParB/RepB/Spo0J family partition protein n=1 Tax=Microbacterium sp. NPDC078428 TaxID=3364190 RepID=UPI0037C7FB7C
MGENYFETARDINDLVLGHRIRSDYGDLSALTESIRLIGFVQPITITPTGAVVSGGRRLQAARALGLRTVDVWVRTDITSELELLLAEQQENENRKPYTRIEQARFFDQLRRIFAEDAALRQQATRFGAPPGAPDSGAPAPSATGRRTHASERAAMVVTGRRSDYTLGHIVELLQLQADPDQSERVRRAVEEAISLIDPYGPVEPNYLRVKIVQDTEQLQLIAGDDSLPAPARDLAHRELQALPVTGKPSQVREAARQALRRVTAAEQSPPGAPAKVAGGRSQAAIRIYSPRALTGMVAELDSWWLHYDPSEVARTLTDEQWEQLTDWVQHTVRFLEEATRLRNSVAA